MRAQSRPKRLATSTSRCGKRPVDVLRVKLLAQRFEQGWGDETAAKNGRTGRVDWRCGDLRWQIGVERAQVTGCREHQG